MVKNSDGDVVVGRNDAVGIVGPTARDRRVHR